MPAGMLLTGRFMPGFLLYHHSFILLIDDLNSQEHPSLATSVNARSGNNSPSLQFIFLEKKIKNNEIRM